VVATNTSQNELTVLRRLVGEREGPKGEATGEETDSGSELSSLVSEDSDRGCDREEEEEEEKEEKKESGDNGRPNFRRVVADEEAPKSDREWFNRGKKGGDVAAT
jgi:hypothetical protein